MVRKNGREYLISIDNDGHFGKKRISADFVPGYLMIEYPNWNCEDVGIKVTGGFDILLLFMLLRIFVHYDMKIDDLQGQIDEKVTTQAREEAEKMASQASGLWDLTLFTCTYGGRARVTV
ncbi:MAG: hypothetical protein LUF92_04345 [Clostridiales bacterium]|nr:hypothetical protein [Clostridiales bacterium]